MEKINKIIDDLLLDFKDNEDIIGAIFCGSMQSENNNKYSDMELHIITNNNNLYSKRGIKKKEEYLIEYFINPINKIYDYFDTDYLNNKLTMASMIGFGKIIFDNTGELKILQKNAMIYIDKKMPTVKKNKILLNQYFNWNKINQLKRCIFEEDKIFHTLFYDLLNDLYKQYCNFFSITLYPISKLNNIFTNNEFRIKYHALTIPDEKFIKLFLNCLEPDIKETMLQNIMLLSDLYNTRVGEFDINKFNIITKIEEEKNND